MRKRINLFRYDTRTVTPKFVAEVQKYAVAIGIVLFMVFLAANALFLFFRLQLNSYNKQKAALLTRILDSKDTEAQMLYFAKKENQLVTFSKEDTKFLPYYNLLKDLLQFSSNSPVLESMTLNKTRATEFVVGFSTFDQAFQFLHFVEQDTFLNNFVELKLDKFVVADTGAISGKGYQLKFHGTFKDLQ